MRKFILIVLFVFIGAVSSCTVNTAEKENFAATPLSTQAHENNSEIIIEPIPEIHKNDIVFYCCWDRVTIKYRNTNNYPEKYVLITENNIYESFKDRFYIKSNDKNVLHDSITIRIFDDNDILLDEAIINNVYIFDKDSNEPLNDIAENIKNIERLFVDAYLNLEEADSLGKMNNLVQLQMSSCGELVNLSSISKLEKLEILNLTSFRGDDLSFLDNLTMIYDLELQNFGAEIDNLNFLKNYRELEFLNIGFRNCTVQNLDILSDLTNLCELKIYDLQELENIDVISRLNNLNSLTLESLGSIKDISVLYSLDDLKKLILAGVGKHNAEEPQIEYEYVGQLKNLEQLSVCLYEVVDLSWVGSLTNLRKLELYRSEEINDYSSLKNLDKLRELTLGSEKEWLFHNNNVDVSFLSELSNLKHLSVSTNNPEAFVNIAELNSLIELDINWCDQIPNLEGKLQKLEYLTIMETDIEDVTQLIYLDSLTHLIIDFCNAENVDFSPIEQIENLEYLYLDCEIIDDMQKIPDIRKLTNLNELIIYTSNNVDLSYIYEIEGIERILIS